MNTQSRWEDYCIWHEDEKVEKFCQNYFTKHDRKVVLFAAGGFDQRCTHIPSLLANNHHNQSPRLYTIREERPHPDQDLLERATPNLSTLNNLYPNAETWAIPIFHKEDQHIIGGSELAKRFRNILPDIEECTDVVLDLSAFSTGILFTLSHLAWDYCIAKNINLHVFMSYHPEYDRRIKSINHDRPTLIHGFSDQYGLDENSNQARLWIPHFNPGKRQAIRQIYQTLKSAGESRKSGLDICPVLPFPARDPRTADSDASAFQDEFQDQDPIQSWHIDGRHILHAAQDDPLDLYRQILSVHRARTQVFEQGSQTILSPAGSKILSLGFLLAALDYDLPVYYMESSGYKVELGHDTSQNSTRTLKQLHLWLLGTPYPTGEH